MCPQIFRREAPVYPPQVEWLRKQAELAGIKVHAHIYDMIALANTWLKKKFSAPIPSSVVMLNLSTGEFVEKDGQLRYYPFAEEGVFFINRRSYKGMKLEKRFCDYVKKNLNTTVSILDWSVLLYESYYAIQRALDRIGELESKLEKLTVPKVRTTLPDEWEAFS